MKLSTGLVSKEQKGDVKMRIRPPPSVSLLRVDTENISSDISPSAWAASWFFKDTAHINIYPTVVTFTVTTPANGQTIRGHLLFHQYETDKMWKPLSSAHIKSISIPFHLFLWNGKRWEWRRGSKVQFLPKNIQEISGKKQSHHVSVSFVECIHIGTH